MKFQIDLALPLAAFCLLGVLYGVRLLIRWLAARSIMDHPNHRSSHSRPTPRGGGLAVITMLVLTLGLLAWRFEDPWLGALAVGSVAMATLGWSDDRKGLSARLRLGIQSAIVAALVLALPHETRLVPNILPFGVERIAIALGWLWFVNLYNFMDGIDGLSGLETTMIAVGLALLAGLSMTYPSWGYAGWATAGAAIGFLRWNWHPARIFLGDVGSLPLGFLMGGLLILLASSDNGLIPALLLPLYYLMDATTTLCMRLIRGEKIWQAHREHSYQQAAQRMGRHDGVCWYITALNIILIGLATGAYIWPHFSALALILGLALTGSLLWYFRKGPLSSRPSRIIRP